MTYMYENDTKKSIASCANLKSCLKKEQNKVEYISTNK